MKYYHKYQEALEAAGYTVDAGGYVWDVMGNQSAGEDNYGNVQSKDPNVTDICRQAEAAPVAKKKPVKKPVAKKVEPKNETLEVVRARDKNGHFIADDPSTPDVNESWVVKTVKKAAKK
tara:strand:- start:177 stop:533 length:357 start_codon:yes stop_codon:yes gene_type:complete